MSPPYSISFVAKNYCKTCSAVSEMIRFLSNKEIPQKTKILLERSVSEQKKQWEKENIST